MNSYAMKLLFRDGSRCWVFGTDRRDVEKALLDDCWTYAQIQNVTGAICFALLGTDWFGVQTMKDAQIARIKRAKLYNQRRVRYTEKIGGGDP